MTSYRAVERCPKCTWVGVFDDRYIPNGVTADYPTLLGANYVIGHDQMAIGPCMMKTCRVCGYTYTQPPADGEGVEEKNASDKDTSDGSFGGCGAGKPRS